ncbi:hypothetical protein JWG40_03855 [Leptospira sp. 201903074]|uniref:hypothetical protein n=1 Tax=Leptospira abararensis TaxID=2810036 RepID=UPI0019667E8E|nr:hypothetical protein [Leptospira abararensis]MBM9546135.1 hypothetical protein [Leptospira abararensis]
MKLKITTILLAIFLFATANIFANRTETKQSKTAVHSISIESTAVFHTGIVEKNLDQIDFDQNFLESYSNLKISKTSGGKPNRTTKRNLTYNKPYLVFLMFHHPPNGDFSILRI